MIVAVDAADARLTQLDTGCGHPLLEVAIAGRALCPRGEMEFWLLESGGEQPAARICRNGSVLYITGQDVHAEELAAFAQTVGYARLQTDLVLPLGQPEPMLAVEWQDDAPILPELPDDCRLVYCTKQSSRLSAVEFARLQKDCAVFVSDEEAAAYAASLSHAVRRGMAGAVGLLRGDTLIAGAAVDPVAGQRAVLGAVAVLPQARRRGLGTTIAAVGAALSFAMGRRPYLVCRQQLLPLYTGAGFACMGQLNQYRA